MKKLLSLLGSLMMTATSAHAAGLKVGDAAPDFTAPSSAGTPVHLQEVIGKQPVVLYFYPKDDTPGCTKEACDLRDNFAAFRQLHATIFGISYDSVESHQAFIQKYKLPFVLISDTHKTLAKKYGADGILYAKRMTYVIDKSGRIAWMNPSVNPATHNAELEKVLAGLQ